LLLRKDYLTSRLSALELVQTNCKQLIEGLQSEANRAGAQTVERVETELNASAVEQQIVDAQNYFKQTYLEQTWLMRHLQLTNEAIVPVLNVTRLKAIKGSAFNDHTSGQ